MQANCSIPADREKGMYAVQAEYGFLVLTVCSVALTNTVTKTVA